MDAQTILRFVQPYTKQSVSNNGWSGMSNAELEASLCKFRDEWIAQRDTLDQRIEGTIALIELLRSLRSNGNNGNTA